MFTFYLVVKVLYVVVNGITVLVLASSRKYFFSVLITDMFFRSWEHDIVKYLCYRCSDKEDPKDGKKNNNFKKYLKLLTSLL